MSKAWVIIRDDNDNCGCGCAGCGRGSEVIGVYTLDALALSTVEELNIAAASSGAPERYRVIRADLNSNDRLPGQWVQDDIEAMAGVWVENWRVDGYVPLAALRVHRPEWQPWPAVGGTP